MNQLVDVATAARLLSISKYTVRNRIREGKLRPVRIGTRVLLELSEIENFIAKSKAELPAHSEA